MLSPDQIAARRGKLTGSRVKHLMHGNAKEILNLYYEFTDDPRFEPEDHSRNWNVQRGENSEGLNLRWYEGKGNRVVRRGEFVQHHSIPWGGVTLDGFDLDLQCPIECKDVQGHQPLEVVIEFYQPQFQWLAECTGAARCAISIIIGGAEPRVEYIDRDGEYVHQMIIRGDQFMRHVADRTPPVVLPAVAAPIIADKSIDMTGNEAWSRNAMQWLQAKGAADTVKECEKILKAIMPTDAVKAFGHGIRITRDRANRLSLREDLP